MNIKGIVSLSGGVDSTTCLAKAIEMYKKENVVGVSIIYGQKHIKELECAKKVAKYYGIKHYELDLSNIFANNTTCSLLNQNANIEVETGDYDTQYMNKQGATIATSVPFRNGVFISALVSFGQSLFPDEKIVVFLGNHKDSESGMAIYPDCLKSFTDTFGKAIHIGTAGMVTLYAPYADCIKSEIVKDGLIMMAPYHLTWSCYNGNEKACGKCGTCIDRLKAFADNDEKDTIEYEVD